MTGAGEGRRSLPVWGQTVAAIGRRASQMINSKESAWSVVVGQTGTDHFGEENPHPATANVVIAAPQDPQVLAQVDGELPLAPPALVLADLLTLPNRFDAEAEQLMDLLARDEPGWKA